MLVCTKEHSTVSGTPLSPFKQASAKTAPAWLQEILQSFNRVALLFRARKMVRGIPRHYAMEGVGDPLISSLRFHNLFSSILCSLCESLCVIGFGSGLIV